MNKIITSLILISIFLSFKISLANENKILFKITNKSFTTIDFENRKNYLKFVGDNSELDKKTIMDDFISVVIFNEFYLNSKKNIDLRNKINEIYNNVLNAKNNDSSFDINNYNKDNIFFNLELDLIRKLILEDLLNSKKKEILVSEDEVDLVYKFKIKYLNIYKKQLQDDNTYLKLNEFKNIDDIELFLINQNIKFFKNNKEIKNINKINKNIKKNILNNKNFFKLENEKIISFISIKKSFETYNDLIATLYSIRSNIQLEKNRLLCKNLKNSKDFKLEMKDYEYLKLNNKIKENLLNINDYIEFMNEDNFTYIILCEIKFNKELLNNISINKKINLKINEIENNFIRKYSNMYNLIIMNE